VMRDRLIRRMIEAGEPAPEIIPVAGKTSGQLSVSAEEARL
jgi:hypothetical protein